MKEQIDVWCQGFTQHCWHTQLCILAACMYLEIRALKKRGRLFLIKLSFVWLFGMHRALSRHHLNNLVIFSGNGNVNRVISFSETEVNCSRPAVGEAPLPFSLPSFWNPGYKSFSSGLGWMRKEAKAGGNSKLWEGYTYWLFLFTPQFNILVWKWGNSVPGVQNLSMRRVLSLPWKSHCIISAPRALTS